MWNRPAFYFVYVEILFPSLMGRSVRRQGFYDIFDVKFSS